MPMVAASEPSPSNWQSVSVAFCPVTSPGRFPARSPGSLSDRVPGSLSPRTVNVPSVHESFVIVLVKFSGRSLPISLLIGKPGSRFFGSWSRTSFGSLLMRSAGSLPSGLFLIASRTSCGIFARVSFGSLSMMSLSVPEFVGSLVMRSLGSLSSESFGSLSSRSPGSVLRASLGSLSSRDVPDAGWVVVEVALGSAVASAAVDAVSVELSGASGWVSSGRATAARSMPSASVTSASVTVP